MKAFLVSIPSSKSRNILHDASAVGHLIEEADSRPVSQLALDDAWAPLHFTLTGEYPIPRQKAEELGLEWHEGTLEDAIMGGLPTRYGSSYGPARFLAPPDVSLVAEKLAGVSLDALRARFDPQALEVEQILPQGWEAGSTLKIVEDCFLKLREFYLHAAAKGDAILIYFV